MYWPVGAPRIYAADNHSILHNSIIDDTVSTGENENDSAINEDRPTTRTRRLTVDTGLANGLQEPATGESARGKPETLLKNESKDESRNRKRNKSSVNSLNEKDGEKTSGAEGGIGGEIIAMRPSRSGLFFVSITRTTLSIWQTKPTAVVASIMRSDSSIKSYGDNVDVLLRPDSAVVVIQTVLGYLITYTVASDPNARLYQPTMTRMSSGHARRRSIASRYTQLSQDYADPFSGPGEGQGVRELSVRFRMVIKLDAGISKALALEDELVVATGKPPALQCVRWVPDGSGSQATTALLRSMSWIPKKTFIVDMVHDRPMNISTWITSDGRCFAVRRKSPPKDDNEFPDATTSTDANAFHGYCFHSADSEGLRAVKVAICARFSLIAVACANGEVLVYTAKDYAGHVPLSHRLKAPLSSAAGLGDHPGRVVNCILYSPDGYALFVGFADGWAMWSVYGKLGASSFASDTQQRSNGSGNSSWKLTHDDRWLRGVKDAFWTGSGSQIALLCPEDNRVWVLNLARSAVAGCYSSANVARSLLQTPSGFMIYRGYDLPDLGAIAVETGVWHQVEIPIGYLNRQWPIRSAVTSADGRYVAVAGRRGLAHYSVTSGRWKIFEDPMMEEEFTVRGGMCWHQHVLIAAVESSEGFQIRVISRESALDNVDAIHVQNVVAPVVHLAPSGDDSLLVYTYENRLHHYIINTSDGTVKLVLVGQIELHGIIRAPARVRALSWILSEDQLENGDPSQDVGIATVLFLVDGKLVVLQPSTKDGGELKYDMRIVAQNVEYYVLMRDQQHFLFDSSSESQQQQQQIEDDQKAQESESPAISTYHQNDLRDSLWYFDGSAVQVWTDVQELLASAPPELGRELPPTVTIPVDFYPLSVLLNKGILFGIEPDVTHNRRDAGFSMMKFVTRTQLFIPQILHHHLANFNSPSALYLCHKYTHLAYFSHALEVLLHDILDNEVDNPPSPTNNDSPASSLLPSVITLLSSFPQFLDIVVQCTRKTEVRSWRTLFAHLPPPRVLFERSLEENRLKTAGGYLLVLQTLETSGGTPATSPPAMEDGSEGGGVSQQMVVRLLSRASKEGDWGLGMELARFLVALDGTGEMLKGALEGVGLKGKVDNGQEKQQGLDSMVNGKGNSGLGIL